MRCDLTAMRLTVMRPTLVRPTLARPTLARSTLCATHQPGHDNHDAFKFQPPRLSATTTPLSQYNPGRYRHDCSLATTPLRHDASQPVQRLLASTMLARASTAALKGTQGDKDTRPYLASPSTTAALKGTLASLRALHHLVTHVQRASVSRAQLESLSKALTGTRLTTVRALNIHSDTPLRVCRLATASVYLCLCMSAAPRPADSELY